MAVAESAATRGRVAAGREERPRPRPSVAVRVVSRDLVGRAAELKLLVAAVAHPPAVTIVEGEAGIGKTRLVAELAKHPELLGRRFVVGGCRRIREPFPLGPVVEAVRGMGDALRRVRLSPVVGALRPLLPELDAVLPLLPEPLDDRAAERHRVFRGLTELLNVLGPAVLVLEDLHWADGHTVDFCSYLMAAPPAGLSVVLTFRGDEAAPSMRASLGKLPGAARRAEVLLPPLDVEQTGLLAASILGAERVSTEFAAHLQVRASGVPFAVEELLALLRARGTLISRGGRWSRREIDELHVPTGIGDPVLERVSHLSDDGREVVEAAAVLQEPMPAPVLIDLSRVAGPDAMRGMEEALASGLLVDHGETVGFRHVLAAQAVHEAMPGPRQRDLHNRAAAALQVLDSVPLGRVAHHLRHARRVEEWAQAAERAADQAVGLGHDDEAVRLLEDVLRHAFLDCDSKARLAVKLAKAVAETFESAPEMIDLLQEVLQQNLPRAERGELRFWLALVAGRTGKHAELRRRLLLTAVGDLDDRPDLQAWAMTGLGMVRDPGIPLSEHTSWVHRALEILPKVDNRAFEVYLLSKIVMTLAWVGDSAWRRLTERIEERTDGTPRVRGEVSAYLSVGMVACYAGHHQMADRMLTAALDGAVACESRPLELMIRSELALLDCCRGRWEGLSGRVEELLDAVADMPIVRVDIEVTVGILALAHGDLDRARHRLTSAADQMEMMGGFELLPFAVGALGRVAVACAELDDAAERTDRLVAALESKELWVPVLPALPGATQVLIATNQASKAGALVARASRELADLDAPLAPGGVWHAQGFLDMYNEDWSQAAAHFLRAAELYDSAGCPYDAAQVREQAASALFETGDDGAERALRAALDTYQRLGASWDHGRCLRLGRSHGVRLPVSYRGGRKGYGESLSPREQEVARLAAAGRSSKEIAAELFLSPATVDKYLGRAMRKLRVHSRAAVASRLDRILAGPGRG